MKKAELVRRYVFFLVGLFVNSLGIALITRANLGTSPISSNPYVLSIGFTPSLGMFTLVHMPPQKCNLTADDGASPPPEWCTPSAKMVHGGRERGAPDRHAGDHSGMPLRFRMDSPSIWMV